MIVAARFQLKPMNGGEEFDLEIEELWTETIDLGKDGIDADEVRIQAELTDAGTYDAPTTWTAQETIDNEIWHDVDSAFKDLVGAGISDAMPIPKTPLFRYKLTTPNTSSGKCTLWVVFTKG